MKLPSKIWSQLGPIALNQKEGLLAKDEKDAEFGSWDAIKREIQIDPTSCPAALLQTLCHEMIHVALWDAGVNVPSETEEVICDAIGTYLAGASLAGYITLKVPK